MVWQDYYNEETNMWEKMRKEMNHGQCLIGHFTTSITCPIKISPRKKSLFTSKGILMNEEEFLSNNNTISNIFKQVLELS